METQNENFDVVAWVNDAIDAGWSESEVKARLVEMGYEPAEGTREADANSDDAFEDAPDMDEATDAIDAKRKPHRGPLMELHAADGTALDENDIEAGREIAGGWLQT